MVVLPRDVEPYGAHLVATHSVKEQGTVRYIFTCACITCRQVRTVVQRGGAQLAQGNRTRCAEWIAEDPQIGNPQNSGFGGFCNAFYIIIE